MKQVANAQSQEEICGQEYWSVLNLPGLRSLGYSPPVRQLCSSPLLPLSSRPHYLFCRLPQPLSNWSPCIYFHCSTIAKVTLKQAPYHNLKSYIPEPLPVSRITPPVTLLLTTIQLAWALPVLLLC